MNRIKDTLQQTKTIAEAFPANLSNESYLNGSRLFILGNDFGIAYNWILGMLEANAFLINHFDDLGLHDELKTVVAFGGPTSTMRELTGTSHQTFSGNPEKESI